MALIVPTLALDFPLEVMPNGLYPTQNVMSLTTPSIEKAATRDTFLNMPRSFRAALHPLGKLPEHIKSVRLSRYKLLGHSKIIR